MRIAKFHRVADLLACSLVFVLNFIPAGNHSQAAAQSSANAAGQNATGQQNRGKHSAKRTSDMPGAVPGAAYVGSDTCKNCHNEIYSKHFEGTPHFALLKEGEHGCEDCHGPGSAHVEGGGDKTKIIRFSQLSPGQASQHCLQCHESSLENINFSRSIHLKNDVGCLACHSPHHSTEPDHLLKNQQTLLCCSFSILCSRSVRWHHDSNNLLPLLTSKSQRTSVGMGVGTTISTVKDHSWGLPCRAISTRTSQLFR